MNELDLMGHVAEMILLIGTLCLGNRKHFGWGIRIMGGVIWIYVGYKIGMSSLYVWGFIWAVADARNYIKWRNVK
jgi:hypothetical protein